MIRILVLIVSIFLFTPAFTQHPDSILHSARKPALINPYKNLKTSVLGRVQYHPALGLGFGGGIEFRRFTSLRQYYFFEVSYAQWQKSQTTDNFYHQECTYDLTAQSFSVRLGKAVFGSQHVYLGALFLRDVHLTEKVPAQHLMFIEDEYVTVKGNITPYVRKVTPVFGYNMKVKGWKFMFIEVGGEYVLV
ncbi:MAG TPA: hypothetical protein VFM90_09595, partial [Cyclobacteriaceae bacterium]|nr:hypothetical protein [Cyclobacteriaceae bacterium]